VAEGLRALSRTLSTCARAPSSNGIAFYIVPLLSIWRCATARRGQPTQRARPAGSIIFARVITDYGTEFDRSDRTIRGHCMRNFAQILQRHGSPGLAPGSAAVRRGRDSSNAPCAGS